MTACPELARAVSSPRVTPLATRVTCTGQERVAWRAKDRAKTPGLLGGGAGAGRAVFAEPGAPASPMAPRLRDCSRWPAPARALHLGRRRRALLGGSAGPQGPHPGTREREAGGLLVCTEKGSDRSPRVGPREALGGRGCLRGAPCGGGAAPGRGSRRPGPQVDDQSPEDERP